MNHPSKSNPSWGKEREIAQIRGFDPLSSLGLCLACVLGTKNMQQRIQKQPKKQKQKKKKKHPKCFKFQSKSYLLLILSRCGFFVFKFIWND